MKILVLGEEGMLGHKVYQTSLTRYPVGVSVSASVRKA